MSKLCCSRLLQTSLKLLSQLQPPPTSTIIQDGLRIGGRNLVQTRQKHGHPPRIARPPRIKYPLWFLRKERAKYDEQLTGENREFIREVLHDTVGSPIIKDGVPTYQLTESPLKLDRQQLGQWNSKSRRTGVVAKRLGCYPMWSDKGEPFLTTLFQVVDNHVVKYTPPGEFDPPRQPYRCAAYKRPDLGCLLVGAEYVDPQKYTREYCGLFYAQGMMPKKVLHRFLVTPEAALPPGTPLTACHFQVGRCVDVRGKTIARGFQGVMKRWGFHGMPATHGQTKTHRRPGAIGSGCAKHRVFPGQKLPGHMGNRWRIHRGAQIVRINTKYNVLFIRGQASPGDTNSYVQIFDTLIWPKRHNHHIHPHFPTFFDEDVTEPLAEDLFAEGVFDYAKPSITYE